MPVLARNGEQTLKHAFSDSPPDLVLLDEENGLILGAVDYITKPFSPPIVKIRVRNHLRIVHQYKVLDQLAYLDGLTEISNRRT